MIIATAGHVDHGKTTLVRSLTGVDTDRLEEEQARGLTIDLGFAYADVDDNRLGFIDVPGHIRFIHNMLAGVTVVDFALLVVAADDGIMPQTLEHLAILDLLGISRGAVALTKVDRVVAGRVQEVVDGIDELLASTSLAGSLVYPVSGTTGEGIDALRAGLHDAAKRRQERSISEPFRLCIDRAFNIKGSGVVVTGSVTSGQVKSGDELRLLPGERTVRVRGIHRQNEDSTEGHAGDRCALNIAGANLAKDQISRGQWLAALKAPATSRFDALLTVLPGGRPVRHWMPVHIHTAANHVVGRIATLEAPRIEPGNTGLVQLVTTEPLNVWAGDRLIVRDQAALETLGGGRVLDPFAPTRGRARPPRIENLRARTQDDMIVRLRTLLELHPLGMDVRVFAQGENLATAQLDDQLASVGAVVTDGGLALSSEALSTLTEELMQQVTEWQVAHPDASGMSRNQVMNALPNALPAPVLDHMLSNQVAAGKLTLTGSTYATPDHRPVLSGPEATLWKKVEPLLASDPTRPPVLHDLAKDIGLPPKAVEKMLVRIVQLGYLVHPTPNRFFLPHAMVELKQTAAELAGAEPEGFTVKQFRDATGIGRNLSIEILEFFDRNGTTRRHGDKRTFTGPREINDT